MDFFNQADLDRIQLYAGQPDDPKKRAELKGSYEKLEHLCQKISEKGFEFTIRKDPRKQAGRGKFELQEYQWAQVYPQGFKNDCFKKFAYIVGISDSLHFHMMGIGDYQNYSQSKTSSKKSWTEIDLTGADYNSVVSDFLQFNKSFRSLFIKTGADLGIEICLKTLYKMENEKIKSLLFDKKQIILQGPPGTGKTRLAKQLAKQIIGFDESSYSEESLKSALSIGMQIPNASGVADYYTVKEIKNTSIVLTSERAAHDWEPQFPQILKKLSELERGITPENKKGLNPYELAVAKYLHKNAAMPSIQEEQMELIQFHPSYTYEDFVRGIEAKANDVGIEYRTIDKVLSKLAKKANDNWIDFHSNPEDVNRKEWIQNKLSEYLSQYSESLASSAENKLMLTNSIYVYQVDEDCLRYKGDEWASPSRINFTELSDLILHNLETPEEIEIPKTISNHAFYRRSYYGSVLRSFFEFAGPYNAGAKNSLSLKNYVLIIDEINRANLPSVLGELIYALEYRGESVNTMYELNGDSKITLPKNLFIIGTMNTADRSVGHIDYAIRRRFAFIDILPTDEPIESQEGKELFKKVAELFIKVEDGRVKSSDHLSPDFNFKEVQIGHSYFICDKEKLQQRLEFEIRPILREYLKDGILLSTAEELVETLSL